MDVMSIFGWLFGTREGAIALIVGGILICLLIAFIFERKTRGIYKEHPADEDADWDSDDDDDE